MHKSNNKDLAFEMKNFYGKRGSIEPQAVHLSKLIHKYKDTNRSIDVSRN